MTRYEQGFMDKCAEYGVGLDPARTRYAVGFMSKCADRTLFGIVHGRNDNDE